MSYGVESQTYNLDDKNDAILVDMRSDTVTKPCLNMRRAMFEAEVGDDGCKDDPTVSRLEKSAAELLGKEAAIFIPSGTMGNLISIMNHCNTRGSEIYAGEESHIVEHEQGGAAQIAGVTVCTLPNNPDGTFDLNQLESKIRCPNNILHPISRMISVENTLNGKVIPQKWINEVAALAKRYNLKLHLDGARIWNAVVATNISIEEMVANFDSITFCLSKGLGAPVGSILCGTKEFIDNARRFRKVLGGGMRQVGVLAAPGLIALENRFRLKDDHDKAIILMKGINDIGSKIISVDPNCVQTNMVFMNVAETETVTAKAFAERLGVVMENHKDDKVIVKVYNLWRGCIRIVIHLDITDEMVNAAIKKITYVAKLFDPTIENHLTN